jgi:hypothetical protein
MKILCFLLLASPLLSTEVTVSDAAQLKAALVELRDGTILKLAPGTYPGGHHITAIQELTIEAADPSHPPVFQGGSTAWQFSRCNGLTLRHLKISGQSTNGLNLDDGGRLDERTKGITLENLQISDIGPKGNHDAIKGSGLEKLTVRDCTITGWGGQGIDLVGCHESLITGCKLEGKDGFSATAGIQLKGGTSVVTVEKCEFRNAGERPLNVGGSTGLPFFRPQNATAEASKIVVRDCTIEGSLCAAAFVGVDGAEFSGNTVLYPKKWLFRILQETQEPRFVPCRNVIVKNNRFTFLRSDVSVEVNIGAGTAPETFVFEGNQRTAEDKPEASKPNLPTPER